MKRVYLIRHALPDFSDGQRRCLGRTDIPLGDVGMAQAEAVVAHGGVIELFLQKITGRRYKPRYCEGISLIWENERFTQSEESL